MSTPSLIARPKSTGGRGRGRGGGAQKGSGARKQENNRIYAHPLPLVFSSPSPSSSSSASPPSVITSLLSSLGLLSFLSRPHIENPHCEGIFDPITRSVWVVNHAHAMLLWQRGFFGKGDLSRSEPSWLVRQINLRKERESGKGLTSEEITALRREERRQFKADRARAIAAVAEEAEVIFATEGRVVAPALSGPAIPSAATWRPEGGVSDLRSTRVGVQDKVREEKEEEEEDPENIEHLQLTLQEAWFLLWTLDCLTILDPETMKPMSLYQTFLVFQTCSLPLSLVPQQELTFANPFLVHYAAYHHYRSLGWVIKGGIKFCVDYLLYKRGPVFAHAELAIVLIPVYEDPTDQPPEEEAWGWDWLSTLNRVNSQVQKTLVLTYVTVPSRSRVSPDVLKTPGCWRYYSVREVVVRRFVPARMRD